MKIDRLKGLLSGVCTTCPSGWRLGELTVKLSEEDRAVTVIQKVPKVVLKLRTKDIKKIEFDEDSAALHITFLCNKSEHSFREWRMP